MEKFFRKFGIMTNLHADNAPELTAGNYRRTANDHTINCTSTEPHSQAVEPGSNMVKNYTQRAITHPWGSVGLCPFLAGRSLVRKFVFSDIEITFR
jgi:hypothetical protein